MGRSLTPVSASRPIAGSLQKPRLGKSPHQPGPAPRRRLKAERLRDLLSGNASAVLLNEADDRLAIESIRRPFWPSGGLIVGLSDLLGQAPDGRQVGCREREQQLRDGLVNTKNPSLVIFEDWGSTFVNMVETVGIEPTSAIAYERLLRA
jgi:hypothetical protein